MKGRGFPWARLLLVLLLLAAGFLLHDVHTHGSFQGRWGVTDNPGWKNPLGASGIPHSHHCPMSSQVPHPHPF